MKNNLVFTFIPNNKKGISKYTLNGIKNYAEKINCDFKVVTESDNDYFTQDWYRYKIYDFLKSYNRVLFISSEVIIRCDAPNIFEIVPLDKIGAFDESKYAPRIHILEQDSHFYKKSLKNTNLHYYSTDVLIVSRIHRDLFKLPNDFTGLNDVDSYFNIILNNSEYKVFPISWKFNRKEFMDNVIGITRLDSYFINYKGAPKDIVVDIIKKDINCWAKDAPKFLYKRNILISVSAGMGDQLCSEPVIRYTQKLYPDANIYVKTHFPRLFEHIQGINVTTHDNWKGINDAILTLYTVPDEGFSQHMLSHVLFHPTDFSSISMLRRTLPNKDKSIKLKVDANDVASIMDWVKDKPKDKPGIVIHAGKWWESKTFPVEWWQNVIDKLSEKLTVYLIGKTITDKQGYQPIACPSSGYDFRDLTSLGEMIALISLTKCTLTNDSSPLHIAGAFDNWIVVIPTAKHPDHILPYRNGVQNYKTKALYKKLLLDDLEVRYTEFDTDTIDTIPNNNTLYDYLPSVEEVVSEVLEIYNND